MFFRILNFGPKLLQMTVCKSLFRDGRIDVKSFFNYCTTHQLHKMLKFFFNKQFEIENIKDVFPSTVMKYFINGYTGEEILSFIKTEKQEEKEEKPEKINSNDSYTKKKFL